MRKRTWIDRVRGFGVRVLASLGYEGATTSRRGEGWSAPGGSANDVSQWSLQLLRDRSRHLVRNHWGAKRAVAVLSGKIVGAGILPSSPDEGEFDALLRLWSRPQSQVGAERGQSLAAVQRLACRTVIESGSALVVRRWRTARQMAERGLVMPFQLQVIEPEYLDATRDGMHGDNQIICGIEFDQTGWAVAYWLHRQHPGSTYRSPARDSVRVPASEVAHVYWQERTGQAVGVPWLAAVLLKLHDFDEYEDAQQVRQKIAAMFAVFIQNHGMGTIAADDDAEPLSLEPGRIQRLDPGEEVTFAEPPSVAGFGEYASISLRSIAAGVGLSYEDLSNDYSQVNFSSARMGSLVTRLQLDQWQTEMMIGQLCQSLDAWTREGAEFLGIAAGETRWTAPRRELLDPSREVGAIERAIAAGLTSRQEEVRKLGRDVQSVDEERAQDMAREATLGLLVDVQPEREHDAEVARVEKRVQATIRELRDGSILPNL